MAETTKITKAQYPTLYSALDAISHDCGNQAGHSFHRINSEYTAPALLCRVEKALTMLTSAELQTLVIGEESASFEIGTRSLDLVTANLIFNAFFNRI